MTESCFSTIVTEEGDEVEHYGIDIDLKFTRNVVKPSFQILDISKIMHESLSLTKL